MRFLTVEPGHAYRPIIENHIRRIYMAGYGASIDAFPRHLAAAIDNSGLPVCAAGLRFAPSGFYSENYLDEPIEAAIRRLSGQWVARADLIEITTLASSKPGATLDLFDFIARSGHINGQSWAVFTATTSLRRCLRRIGAPLVEISPALPERLSRAANWGRYYETDPRVCAFKNNPSAPVRFERPRHAVHFHAGSPKVFANLHA